MGFINGYDWITPTNPYASIFFGVMFTLIIACVIWFETKEIRTSFITLSTGIVVTLIGVFILNLIGYYSFY